MRREFHVRFCEGPGGKIPRATRLVLFSDDRARLMPWAREIEGFLRDQLGLRLRSEATRVHAVTDGVPFLGWRLWPRLRRLEPRRLRRVRTKLRALEAAYSAGLVSDDERERRAASLFAHLASGGALGLRRSIAGRDVAEPISS